MNHKKRIMVCNHVLLDYEPIGEMDKELKSDTMICQKCIDQMTYDPTIVPKEVHFACRDCVLKELQGTIRKARLIKN